MIKVAKSIKAHWDGIVGSWETRLTNAGAEAMNGIIQTAKRKAKGFRSFLYFKTIIYLIGSKLKFDLPHSGPHSPTSNVIAAVILDLHLLVPDTFLSFQPLAQKEEEIMSQDQEFVLNLRGHGAAQARFSPRRFSKRQRTSRCPSGR